MSACLSCHAGNTGETDDCYTGAGVVVQMEVGNGGIM